MALAESLSNIKGLQQITISENAGFAIDPAVSAGGLSKEGQLGGGQLGGCHHSH